MKIIIMIGLLFSFFILKNIYQFGYGLNDAFWRVVWSIDEGTIWAKNFSEEKFSKVKVGMSREDVLALLGNPLNDTNKLNRDRFWYYTRQNSGTSDFDQRWVLFDSNNKVEEIRKSFFID